MSKVIDDIEMLSIREACKEFSTVCGRDTLRELIRCGEIQSCTIGKRQYTTKQAISAYFSEKTKQLRN